MPKKKKKVRPIPKGYSTLTPTLSLEDSRVFMAFCKKAFGASLRGGIMTGPDGKVMHAELEIGDSVLMVSDAMGEPPRPGNLMVYAEDADKTFKKAVKAGATVLMPLEDQFWGDRFGRVVDPFGNYWSIASRVENVSPKEMKKRMAGMKPPGAK
jgi:PhnB protein